MNKKIILTILIVGMIILTLFTNCTVPVTADHYENRLARNGSTIELMVDNIKQDVVPNLSGTKAKAEYNIDIWNRGLDSDSFKITETNNHGFVVDLSQTITYNIDPEKSAKITVEIIIDNKAPMTKFDYNTTVLVTSCNNGSNFEQVILKTRILQTYGVELQAWNDNVVTNDEIINEKRIVTFHVDVDNIGTGEDTFKLELIGDYSDWATIKNSSYIYLLQNQKETVAITVKIPRETKMGEVPITLKATSRGDDTSYESPDEFDEVTLEVEVTQLFELILTSSEYYKSGEPGDNIDFTITVTNLGNGDDTAELRKEDFNNNWNWTLSSRKVQLAPINDVAGENIKDITLSVDIPTDINGKNGTYNISIYVYSTDASSRGELQNDGKPLIFTVNVNPKYGLDMLLDYPTNSEEQNIDPGNTITYELTLVNLGNSFDTINLKAHGEKSKWIKFPNADLIILPFGFIRFNVTFEVPNLTDENLIDIKANKYEILINATSENDPYVSAEVKIEPIINTVYKTEMETDLALDESGTAIIKTDPNVDPFYSRFSITIKNCGNTLDQITLSTKESHDWKLNYASGGYNLQTITLTITPGTIKTVSVTIYAPDAAKDGDLEKFTIIAKSQNGKVTSSLNINAIVETAVIKFKNMDVSDKTAGSSTTVNLVVINEGNADAEDVEIKFFDKNSIIHAERIQRIKVNEEVKISFNYELDAGDHDIEARTDWSDETIRKKTTFVSEDMSVVSSLSVLAIILILIIIIVLIVTLLMRAKNRRLEDEAQNPYQARRLNPDYASTGENIPNQDGSMPPKKLKPL